MDRKARFESVFNNSSAEQNIHKVEPLSSPKMEPRIAVHNDNVKN